MTHPQRSCNTLQSRLHQKLWHTQSPRRQGGMSWHTLGFVIGVLCLLWGGWVMLQKWQVQGGSQGLPWEDKKQQAVHQLQQETLDMLEKAYTQFTEDNGTQASMKASELLAYLSYTVQVTDGFLMGSTRCTEEELTCYRLHNGGVIGFDTKSSFTGTSPEDVLLFQYDADGSGTLAHTITLAITLEGKVNLYKGGKPWKSTVLTPIIL
ncbi:MAG: hypothetical protein ACKO37_05760 [Vampirovibrionales bacterium]